MEGVMDGTSVPTLENSTVFGPELPREEEKDEETIKTAQTRIDNDWGISIEGSTVGIGSSNAAEASSTLVASASNSGTVPVQIQDNMKRYNERIGTNNDPSRILMKYLLSRCRHHHMSWIMM